MSALNDLPEAVVSSALHRDTNCNDFGFVVGSIFGGGIRPIRRSYELCCTELGIESGTLDGKCVLDLGCDVACNFAQQCITAESVFSLSPDFANGFVRSEARGHGVQLAVAALGQRLPFRDSVFDVVLMHHVLEWLVGRKGARRAVQQVLFESIRV